MSRKQISSEQTIHIELNILLCVRVNYSLLFTICEFRLPKINRTAVLLLLLLFSRFTESKYAFLNIKLGKKITLTVYFLFWN